jgi:hypothetical protein
MLGLFDPSIPIRISHAMRTAGQWTASGVLYASDHFRAPGMFYDEPTVFAVEPGYFALSAALNLAAAYRPEVP